MPIAVEKLLNHNFAELNLFDGYLMKLFFVKDENEQFKIIQNYLDNIPTTTGMSYSEGQTGIAWSICLFGKENNIDVEHIVKYFDENIFTFTYKCFEENRYDYLYDGFGGVLYFIERKKERQLKELLDIYTKKSKKVNGYQVWLDPNQIDKKSDIINLSLSHGMASILGICLIGIKENVCKKEFLEILDNLVNFFQMFYSGNEPSFYPNYVEKEHAKDYTKRLSWCYGDLGVLYQLYCASIVLRNDYLRILTLDNLITLTKYTYEDAKIEDACLCHGSMGISYIFYKLYKKTENINFKNASTDWENFSLNLLKEKNNLFYSPEQNNWLEDYSFLEGLTGVYLAYLTKKGEIQETWDRTLLLS